jgi:hypothetical protein
MGGNLSEAVPIPEDLLRFLNANVDSIEQLELLRITGEYPDRQWNVQELATKAQASLASIAVLEQRGFLKTQTCGSVVICTRGTMVPETEAMLARLLQFYNERPVTLIRIVFASASERLKAFSDAFRLRKDS